MSDYVPHIGDRVKVTTFGHIDKDGDFRVDRESGSDYLWKSTLRDPRVVVERLPDPEPEWQAGDAALGPNGIQYGYIGGPYPWCEIRFEAGGALSSWVSSNGLRDEDVPRPLAPLLRGGKPWTEAVGGAS